MTLRNHFIFWSGMAAVFLALLWIFKSVLLPFVLGMVIAYLLNPLVNALGRIKVRRSVAALLIVSIFIFVVLAALTAILPILYTELRQLSDDLPAYADKLIAYMAPFSERLQDYTGQDNGETLKALMKEHTGSAVSVTKNVLAGIMAGGKAFADFLTVLVITPIVAYFMMKEWPHITDWAEGLIPRGSKKMILDLLKEIDTKLAGFIRGQFSVALILGVVYAVSLTVAGLNYGFLIGFGAGVLSIIPMVGSTLGLLVSVLVAWFQTGEWSFVLIIAAIFLIGQLVEGNFLTPKIVGKSVGLHPLWIFFALLAGGSLLGILGMLIAVPVAIVASVLAAFAIKRYKASSYYLEGKKKNG